jgi:hypothetical protein
MRKIGFGALLAFMLTFTTASMGHAQSAEDLARGQSPGVRYSAPSSDICSKSKLVIDIRGNEVTYGEILEWQSDSNCNPGMTIGALHKYSINHVTNQYKEGNKVILELDGGNVPLGETKVIIDGYEATHCDRQGKCYGGFMREQ